MTTFATALAHARRGEFAAAEAILVPLLRRDARNANALHLLANIRHARGDLDGALQHFEAAARLAPADPTLAFNHAVALAAAGRHGEAAEAFARTLAARPHDVEALLARGASLAAVKDFAGALECYDAAFAAGLDRADLHANRGAALAELCRHAEALAACDLALAKAPNDAKAHFNRGAALLALNRYDESLAALDTALALDPEHAGAHAARSSALASLGRFDAALADIAFALARDGDSADHLMRLGYVYAAANRRAEGLAAYERVLAQAPDHAEARYGVADSLLAAGDFERGLAFYEARLLMGKQVCPPSLAPLWSGEDIAGKTLLVQGEQGFGDLFQFCRFIPELSRSARIVLQERPQTRALMQSLAGLSSFVANTLSPPKADFRIPLCSLMRVLGVRLATIPANIPYLAADSTRAEIWRQKLGPARRKRIGVCWMGNKQYATTQRSRALTPVALEALLAADADFVSLQLDAGDAAPLLATHGVRDFGRETGDFADLAALIENLDLVITIDTGVAHLAGALGKPLWIMLPFSADWRWLLDRGDTPWYPHARLFRQPAYGDWKSVTDAVLAALQ